MDTFVICYLSFCYIILGLISLLAYRCEFEESWPITYLNPNNARNIRIYFRLIIILFWPLMLILTIIMVIFTNISTFFKIVFKGLYKFITE